MIYKNKKTIFILLIILLLFFILGFSFYFFTKKSTNIMNNVDVVKNAETQESEQGLNNQKPTIKNNETENTEVATKPEPLSTTNNIQSERTNLLDEFFWANQIDEKIKEWYKTKNNSLLKEAVLFLKYTSNETLLIPWSDFLKENSKILFEVAKEEADSGLVLEIYFIFEWFIKGSGDFELLSTEKQIEVSEQFIKLNKLIN